MLISRPIRRHPTSAALLLCLLLGAAGNAGAMNFEIVDDAREVIVADAGRSIGAQGNFALEWIRAERRIWQLPLPAYTPDA